VTEPQRGRHNFQSRELCRLRRSGKEHLMDVHGAAFRSLNLPQCKIPLMRTATITAGSRA
jgi:hypothetical protein